MTVSRRMGLTVTLIVAAHLFASRVVASYAPAPPQRSMLPQNGPATVQRVTVSATLDDLPYVPGRLLIKFKGSVNACIDCLVGQRCTAPVRSTDYVNVLHAGSIRPPGNWPVGISYPWAQSSYGPGSMAIGDIDGDLLPEVVSASGICGRHEGSWSDDYRGEFRCFTISAYDRFGNLLPGFPKATPGPGTTSSMTPGIGDLAGDGLKEIVWIDWYGNVLVWDVPGTPAPETLQWPMARHDAAHTGALTVLH